MEKMDVSSTRSFAVDEILLLRSLAYIKKKRGPKIDLWETPGHTDSQKNDWVIRSTLWNMFFTKMLMWFKGGPDIPMEKTLMQNSIKNFGYI